MRTYRVAFLVLLAANIVAAGILAGSRWRGRSAGVSRPVPARSSGSAADATANGIKPAPSAAETPLGPVELSPQRMQSIGVTTGEVQQKFVEDEIRTTGNVVVDETTLTYVQVRFSGYIQKVFADAAYQYVRQGQPLFTIYSPQLVATEREYLAAKGNQQLLASRIPGVAAGAASLVDASIDRLAQWGVSRQEIARLKSTGEVRQSLEIDSPVSGYIVERNALPNLTVEPATRLYTIAGLATVWVQAQVFQNDLGRVKIGDPAALTVDAYPGSVFSGRVDFIYPQVDMNTRAASVRIVFANPGLILKPGMFVNVSLKIPLGRHLVIPASGVLQSGARQIVFVDLGNGYLDPRDVQLGVQVGDEFIVLKGLKAGERIVTSANFLIDSESQLQAALGSFVPPPPGAGAASAVNAPRGNINLTTDPSPPRKGANILRVRLTDGNGVPIAGAEVTATFFMSAMPAMGMAAMRTVSSFGDKGGGTYEGSCRLGSGGTWQVTVVARKGGQTVATRQMSVNAEGGM